MIVDVQSSMFFEMYVFEVVPQLDIQNQEK